MTNRHDEADPLIERAREDAQGTQLQSDPSSGSALEHEREEAQGTEVFEDPDATLPAAVLKEGAPGHETFTEDALGIRGDEEEERVDENDR